MLVDISTTPLCDQGLAVSPASSVSNTVRNSTPTPRLRDSSSLEGEKSDIATAHEHLVSATMREVVLPLLTRGGEAGGFLHRTLLPRLGGAVLEFRGDSELTS